MTARALFLVILALGLGDSALAASPEYMMEDCKNDAHIFFNDYQAPCEVKYEGQRTDSTHAVNGTIQLGGRSEDFQCS
jgi:hypothetical protein